MREVPPKIEWTIRNDASFTRDNQPEIWVPPGWKLLSKRGFSPNEPHIHTSWATFSHPERTRRSGKVVCVHSFSDYSNVYLTDGSLCETSPSVGIGLRPGDEVLFEGNRVLVETLQEGSQIIDCKLLEKK